MFLRAGRHCCTHGPGTSSSLLVNSATLPCYRCVLAALGDEMFSGVGRCAVLLGGQVNKRLNIEHPFLRVSLCISRIQDDSGVHNAVVPLFVLVGLGVKSHVESHIEQALCERVDKNPLEARNAVTDCFTGVTVLAFVDTCTVQTCFSICFLFHL